MALHPLYRHLRSRISPTDDIDWNPGTASISWLYDIDTLANHVLPIGRLSESYTASVSDSMAATDSAGGAKGGEVLRDNLILTTSTVTWDS